MTTPEVAGNDEIKNRIDVTLRGQTLGFDPAYPGDIVAHVNGAKNGLPDWMPVMTSSKSTDGVSWRLVLWTDHGQVFIQT